MNSIRIIHRSNTVVHRTTGALRIIYMRGGPPGPPGGAGTALPLLGAGPADELVAGNAAGTALARTGFTVAALLAAARARASHTGTQLAATISDFASAVGALLTWGNVSGKPTSFPPSAHGHGVGDISGLGAAATRSIGTSAGQIRDAADPAYSNARTPTAHTHPLSDLAQSGALTGQSPVWNGSAWVPQTISAAPGGSGGQVQWNNAGVFAGLANSSATTAGQLNVRCETAGTPSLTARHNSTNSPAIRVLNSAGGTAIELNSNGTIATPSALGFTGTGVNTGINFFSQWNAFYTDNDTTTTVLTSRTGLASILSIRGGHSSSTVRISHLPSSTAGLPSGTLWNDAGIAKVTP